MLTRRVAAVLALSPLLPVPDKRDGLKLFSQSHPHHVAYVCVFFFAHDTFLFFFFVLFFTYVDVPFLCLSSLVLLMINVHLIDYLQNGRRQ